MPAPRLPLILFWALGVYATALAAMVAAREQQPVSQRRVTLALLLIATQHLKVGADSAGTAAGTRARDHLPAAGRDSSSLTWLAS